MPRSDRPIAFAIAMMVAAASGFTARRSRLRSRVGRRLDHRSLARETGPATDSAPYRRYWGDWLVDRTTTVLPM
jgi:hypothetical protein